MDKTGAEQRRESTTADKPLAAVAIDSDVEQILQAAADEEGAPVGDALHWDENGNKATLELVSERISDLSAALKEAGVQASVWRVDHYQTSQFKPGAKGPDGRVVRNLTHQIKAWLVRRNGWSATKFREILVEEFAAAAPQYDAPPKVEPAADMLAVIGIFDAHFGQLSWPDETGADITVETTRRRYQRAFQDLLGRVQTFSPGRILYILGNDFLHVDQGSSTTKGTPQDADGRWQQAFLCGMQCAFDLVDAARLLAPVDVVVVAGNHEKEKIFCMGEVLSARYADAENVTVRNSPNPWQYYSYGTTLLGFTHGDGLTDAKRLQLPARMAQDEPDLWAKTTCREWFLGHLHRERETITVQRNADTVGCVIVRELPALTGLDSWHNKQGYSANPQAELHLYGRGTGRYGYLVHNPAD